MEEDRPQDVIRRDNFFEELGKLVFIRKGARIMSGAINTIFRLPSCNSKIGKRRRWSKRRAKCSLG